MSKKKGKRYRYQTNTQDLDWQEERADAAQNIGDTQRLVSAIAIAPTGSSTVPTTSARRSAPPELRSFGLAVPAAAFDFRPRPLA